jgi:hypothetical protein
MAIKGKSKSRGGKGRSVSAPRPVIGERKPKLTARKGVRRGVVIALAVMALLGALRVWQNVGRSGDLKAYDRALRRAQGPLTQHFEQTSLTSWPNNIKEFTDGKLDPKRFKELAALWEKDFKAAKDAVAKLKPPKQLGDGQDLIVQGIEGYIGMTRLYQVAATQREIADDEQSLAKATKDAAQKKKIEEQAKKAEDQVQVILIQIGEWQTRSDALYKHGVDKLDALKKEWGIEKPATSQTGVATPPAGLVTAFFPRFAF